MSGAVTIDKENRTIKDVPFSSAAPVERYAWNLDVNENEEIGYRFQEILSQDAKSWDLSRVKNGVCPFLQGHIFSQKLGQVLKVIFRDGQGYFDVKLRRTQAADELINDIEDNIAGGVSFGYIVKKYKVISPAVWEGQGWDRRVKKLAVLEGVEIELFEISEANIPADPNVGFGAKSEEKISLRSIEIDGNPEWEQRANHEDLKKGDWVKWSSSGGGTTGKIAQKATDGVISPSTGSLRMDCSSDNPGFRVQTWDKSNDELKDEYTVHRADALTKIEAPASSTKSLGLETKEFDKSKFFPYDYASTLKEKYPSIWKKGGNIRGNETFELWTSYRKGERTDTINYWIDTERPAWGARHYQDNQVAGVVAQIKWGVIGTLGVDGMKKLINEEKEKVDEKNEKNKDVDEAQFKEFQDENLKMATRMEQLEKTLGDMQSQLTAKDEEVKALQRRQQITDKYTALRVRAEELLNAAKLSAAEFDDSFGERAADIEKFIGQESSEFELRSIEFWLGKVEKRAPILNLEHKTADYLPRQEKQKEEKDEDLEKAQNAYESAYLG